MNKFILYRIAQLFFVCLIFPICSGCEKQRANQKEEHEIGCVANLKDTTNYVFLGESSIDEFGLPVRNDCYRFGGEGIRRENGFVPNVSTAVAIARVILSGIYGEQCIEKELPFRAYILEDSIWVVSGSLPSNAFGGVAYIEISKESGKILKVIHEK